MKIIKKWDWLYWAVVVVFIIRTVVNDPYFGVTTAGFGGGLAVGVIMFMVLPAIFIYIILKSIQILITKIKTQEDKTKPIIIMVCIIVFALYLGYKSYGLYYGI